VNFSIGIKKQDKTIIAIGSKSVYYHHTKAFTIKCCNEINKGEHV
jgi:hypothetical protein